MGTSNRRGNDQYMKDIETLLEDDIIKQKKKE